MRAARLFRFPVKGFPAEELTEARVVRDRGIRGDRIAAFTNGSLDVPADAWYATAVNTLASLTPTERTLIRYLLQGLNARQISEIRVVGIETVKSQIHSIREKFGCSRTKDIVAFIRQLGLEHLFL